MNNQPTITYEPITDAAQQVIFGSFAHPYAPWFRVFADGLYIGDAMHWHTYSDGRQVWVAGSSDSYPSLEAAAAALVARCEAGEIPTCYLCGYGMGQHDDDCLWTVALATGKGVAR